MDLTNKLSEATKECANKSLVACPKCGGTGEERYNDEAGSRDYRRCKKCNGKSFVVIQREE